MCRSFTLYRAVAQRIRIDAARISPQTRKGADESRRIIQTYRRQICRIYILECKICREYAHIIARHSPESNYRCHRIGSNQRMASTNGAGAHDNIELKMERIRNLRPKILCALCVLCGEMMAAMKIRIGSAVAAYFDRWVEGPDGQARDDQPARQSDHKGVPLLGRNDEGTEVDHFRANRQLEFVYARFQGRVIGAFEANPISLVRPEAPSV
jgi:hypothetical protein